MSRYIVIFDDGSIAALSSDIVSDDIMLAADEREIDLIDTKTGTEFTDGEWVKIRELGS